MEMVVKHWNRLSREMLSLEVCLRHLDVALTDMV